MKNIRTGNGADIFCLDLLSLFDYWSYFRPPFFKTGIFRPMSVHKYGWRPGGSVPNLDPNKDSETSLFIFMDVGWTGSARYLQYHTGYRKKYGKALKFYYFCRKSVEFGRIYQVKLGARDRAQRIIDDVLKLSVQNASGEMVPFSAFMRMEEQLGMAQINRYNMYSTASVTCNVAPGSSSGEAIQQMEALFKEQLGDEFGYEWTSVAYQETQAGTTTTVVFVMALLVAFLVLAAQYESWTSPVAAVIGLPVALLGAMIGCLIMGTPVSIYTQIGIILLVALSAKNGILIVEFARDFRAQGNSIRDAAFQAGHIRLRPILMTSLAFVFGVMPLLFATGAGAESRIALGAAVVFGMALNTLLATVYIPNFYELMQKIQEKFRF